MGEIQAWAHEEPYRDRRFSVCTADGRKADIKRVPDRKGSSHEGTHDRHSGNLHDRSCRLRLGCEHLGTHHPRDEPSCRSQPAASNHPGGCGDCSYLSRAWNHPDSCGNCSGFTCPADSRNSNGRGPLVRSCIWSLYRAESLIMGVRRLRVRCLHYRYSEHQDYDGGH
jgi:hypothetical protein